MENHTAADLKRTTLIEVLNAIVISVIGNSSTLLPCDNRMDAEAEMLHYTNLLICSSHPSSEQTMKAYL